MDFFFFLVLLEEKLVSNSGMLASLKNPAYKITNIKVHILSKYQNTEAATFI